MNGLKQPNFNGIVTFACMLTLCYIAISNYLTILDRFREVNLNYNIKVIFTSLAFVWICTIMNDTLNNKKDSVYNGRKKSAFVILKVFFHTCWLVILVYRYFFKQEDAVPIVIEFIIYIVFYFFIFKINKSNNEYNNRHAYSRGDR